MYKNKKNNNVHIPCTLLFVIYTIKLRKCYWIEVTFVQSYSNSCGDNVYTFVQTVQTHVKQVTQGVQEIENVESNIIAAIIIITQAKVSFYKSATAK